ncbi:hypothetical protein VP01_6150g1, partial [Puccinia sorghi]
FNWYYKPGHQIAKPSCHLVTNFPPKPIFKNQTCSEEITYHCSILEVFTRIEAKTLDFSILDNLKKFRAQLDFADNEASSKLDSHNLGKLFKSLVCELHYLVHYLRLIDFNGKWEMNLLFEEYYTFNQANPEARIDSPALLMANLIWILNSLLGMSDQVKGFILEAIEVNSQVQKLLYLKGCLDKLKCIPNFFLQIYNFLYLETIDKVWLLLNNNFQELYHPRNITTMQGKQAGKN